MANCQSVSRLFSAVFSIMLLIIVAGANLSSALAEEIGTTSSVASACGISENTMEAVELEQPPEAANPLSEKLLINVGEGTAPSTKRGFVGCVPHQSALLLSFGGVENWGNQPDWHTRYQRHFPSDEYAVSHTIGFFSGKELHQGVSMGGVRRQPQYLQVYERASGLQCLPEPSRLGSGITRVERLPDIVQTKHWAGLPLHYGQGDFQQPVITEESAIRLSSIADLCRLVHPESGPRHEYPSWPLLVHPGHRGAVGPGLLFRMSAFQTSGWRGG